MPFTHSHPCAVCHTSVACGHEQVQDEGRAVCMAWWMDKDAHRCEDHDGYARCGYCGDWVPTEELAHGYCTACVIEGGSVMDSYTAVMRRPYTFLVTDSAGEPAYVAEASADLVQLHTYGILKGVSCLTPELADDLASALTKAAWRANRLRSEAK